MPTEPTPEQLEGFATLAELSAYRYATTKLMESIRAVVRAQSPTDEAPLRALLQAKLSLEACRRSGETAPAGAMPAAKAAWDRAEAAALHSIAEQLGRILDAPGTPAEP